MSLRAGAELVWLLSFCMGSGILSSCPGDRHGALKAREKLIQRSPGPYLKKTEATVSWLFTSLDLLAAEDLGA